MLDELSKNDKNWREIATAICGNPQDADDLVNDMYIKLHKSKKTYKQIDKWYVIRVIRNLFIDQCRKRKTISIEGMVFIQQIDETLEDRKIINEALNELRLLDREILLHTRERSYSANERYLGIKRSTIFSMQKEALKRLKNTNTIINYGKENYKSEP